MLSDSAFRAQLALSGQRELFDYWLEIKGRRTVPTRADFNPIKVPRLLPHLGIIDLRNGFDEGLFRLAGTRLRDVYGREITGLRMSEVFSGRYATPWHQIHTRIASEAASAQGIVHGPSKGREHVVLLWLRLPLSDNGTHVDRILCHDVAVSRDSLEAPSEVTYFGGPKGEQDVRVCSDPMSAPTSDPVTEPLSLDASALRSCR